MSDAPAGENAAPCPTCGKPGVPAFRPFCSKRCADVDLQRWFTGRYAIPVVDDEAAVDPSGEENGAGQGGSGSL
jgi:endogenous inhibitor of DNA gyrase (YacG/DUF329 family)